MFVVFIIHFNSAKEFSEFQIALWATQFQLFQKMKIHIWKSFVCGLFHISHLCFSISYILQPSTKSNKEKEF